jgi:chromosome segregation ATPase
MMQIAGIETYLLVPASAVLVVAIAILLIRKTGGMRRGPSPEGRFEGGDRDTDMSDEPKSVDTDEVQKFKAKVDQLSTALNLEREKVRAKEEQIKEHEKSYENELLKVNALKDEVPFLRKKIGELQEEQESGKEKFDEEIKKIKADSESSLTQQKTRYEEEIQKLREKIEETISTSAASAEELKEEAKLRLEDIINRHKGELAAKDTEIMDLAETGKNEREKLKKELLSERQELIKSYEDKILEVKAKTKETIQRLVDEKDGLVDRLKEDNEKLEDEVDRLKERIRLLEVDRL